MKARTSISKAGQLVLPIRRIRKIKDEVKHLGHSIRHWKPVAIVFLLLFVVVLLLSQCLHLRSSSYSTRPSSAPEGVVLLPVDEDGLEADFFYRKSDRPQKAVIMLGGSEGGRIWSYRPEFIQELTTRGFCVLSLPYFATNSLPTEHRGIPLEYFQKAFQWLASQGERVLHDDYALIGVSRGAELALLLGSQYPEVKAVIAIDPSSVVWPGMVDYLGKQHSAWSEKGMELPFVKIPYSWASIIGMISHRSTRVFEKALQDTRQVKDASIPAEKIQAPILLISFKRDQVWPSTLMCGQIVERLQKSHFQFYYEHADYDGSHSEWSIEACHRKMLKFLAERFL